MITNGEERRGKGVKKWGANKSGRERRSRKDDSRRGEMRRSKRGLRVVAFTVPKRRWVLINGGRERSELEGAYRNVEDIQEGINYLKYYIWLIRFKGASVLVK